MNDLDSLIRLFSHLPGFGARSARRVVLNLVKNKEKKFSPLIESMKKVYETVDTCPVCGNFDTVSPCSICSDPRRDEQQICVVQDVADLWAIERSGAFRGHYHVLGGLLSAIDRIGPEDLRLDLLHDRIIDNQVQELILALPTTVEGQTTALYIENELKGITHITGLAQGIPFGGELDYLDNDTIFMAISSRK